MQSGDAGTAERLCRDALRRFAGDPNLLSLLGVALLGQNRAAEAEESLSQAVALAPGMARAWEGRAQARLAQGRGRDALGDLLRARQLEPRRASVLASLGQVYTALGDPPSACQALTELAGLRPDDATVLQQLAGVLCRLNRLAEAEAVLGRAVSIAGAPARAWFDLGVVQQQRDRLEAAQRSFQQAVELEPTHAAAWVGLGTVQVIAGRHEAALSAFRRALELDADDADALAGMGHVLKIVGDAEGAVAAYRRCIAAHPGDGLAHWALADFKTFQFDDQEVATMRGQLASAALPPEQRTAMLFALGTALDQRRDFDAAFECFRLGNALRRERQPYDVRQTAQFHDQLIEVFSREFLLERAGQGNPDPAPIFIVGLPRSGSTLVEQILASHHLVDGTYELAELDQLARATGRGRPGGEAYPFTVRQLSAGQAFELGSRYLERTRPYRGDAPRFTDKMPNNFAHVGLLALILPNARIVNVHRDPLDTCLSCYMQLFAHGQRFAYDLEDLGHYYLQYQRLMDHWHDVLPGKILDLQYEELVGDFEAQLRRLLDYCGLPWDDACLRFHENRRAVRTASSEQVRRPLYSRIRPRWLDYEKHLGPLFDALGRTPPT